MIVERAKIGIKRFPFLYNLLRSSLALFHRARCTLFPQNGKEHFRRFCSDLSNIVSEPLFVKVGANDGITGDPCSDILLADQKWKGMLIEPVPYIFERLKTTFEDSQRFRLEQVAIGANAGKATFYFVDSVAVKRIPNLPKCFDQLGSFDKNHILKHLNGILDPFIVECIVDVYPLSDVLERNGLRGITLLHIDCEGYDYEVLQTLSFAKEIPLVIFIEHAHLSHVQKVALNSLLCSHGYSIQDCGLDYFAVNRSVYRRLVGRWTFMKRRFLRVFTGEWLPKELKNRFRN